MDIKKFTGIIVFLIFLLILIIIVSNKSEENEFKTIKAASYLKILSSNENKDLESIINNFEKKNNITIDITYDNTLDVIDRLNSGEDYDAVWISNSMWLGMLNSDIRVNDSIITNINPVVFGVRKKKAKELELINKDVTLEYILNQINSSNLKFAVTNATQTNTGASSYLNFLNILAGNPSVLKEEHLNNETTKENLKKLYSNVKRTSGSEEYIEKLYLDGETDATITYESSIININKKIKNDDDKIYAIYPVDGVAISDAQLGFLKEQNTDKEVAFLELTKYLVSTSVQDEMINLGKRAWFGGINKDAPKDIFNKDYGIDTTKYLYETKYPSKEIIKKALNLYQTELRKPVSIVFALDYSGSMYGEGQSELEKAMNYILNKEEASEDLLQFTKNDKISLLTFNSRVSAITAATNGEETSNLLDIIKNSETEGTTNIWDSVTKSINYLQNEDTNKYNLSIVLMTDGAGNAGNRNLMFNTIKNAKIKVPVYSIMFASADKSQLDEIANNTGGEVFDGSKDLKKAFKKVRGFN